jgi:hypothetical protein
MRFAQSALRSSRWFSVTFLLGELGEKPCFGAPHTGAGSFIRLPWGRVGGSVIAPVLISIFLESSLTNMAP